MFETLIVQPVFNLLVFIYAVLPGHNFGLAVILFTVVVRFIMHPLIKKQLHHNRAMNRLKPKIDEIKKKTKGDSQKTAKLTMELYKEEEISPFSGFGTLAVQVVVLIGLYVGLRQFAANPHVILDSTYSWIKNMGVLKELAADIHKLDFTLFRLVDLSRAAGGPQGFYLPAFVLVIGSGVSQYFMGKQTLPESKDSLSLKKILKPEKNQRPEFQSLFGQMLKYLIPLFIMAFTYALPSVLALYWLTTGAVGYFQQGIILNQDEAELLKTATAKK